MWTPDRTDKELDRLIQSWEKYRQLVMSALEASESSRGQEKKFLQLKARLASQIQFVAESLPRSVDLDSRRQLDAMSDIVKRHVTLTSRDLHTPWDREDFENTWHQYFIFLNQLRGIEQSSGTAPPNKNRDSAAGSSGSNPWSQLGWIAAFGMLAVLVFVIASAAGLSLSPHDGISYSAPKNLEHALQKATHAFDVLGDTLHLLAAPVVDSYGAVWSLILIVSLVSLFGLFVIRRA